MKAYKNSFLTRILGAYRLITPSNKYIYFIVMYNYFWNAEISETYDLKGSSINRFIEYEDQKPGVAMKDNNWVQNNRNIVLDEVLHNKVVTQLEVDTTFLMSKNICDYSLIIGIPDEVKPSDLYKTDYEDETGCIVDANGVKYIIGIVDILTVWDAGKFAERASKTVILRQDGNEISALQPEAYNSRFMKFVEGSVFSH